MISKHRRQSPLDFLALQFLPLSLSRNIAYQKWKTNVVCGSARTQRLTVDCPAGSRRAASTIYHSSRQLPAGMFCPPHKVFRYRAEDRLVHLRLWARSLRENHGLPAPVLDFTLCEHVANTRNWNCHEPSCRIPVVPVGREARQILLRSSTWASGPAMCVRRSTCEDATFGRRLERHGPRARLQSRSESSYASVSRVVSMAFCRDVGPGFLGRA